MPEPLVILSGSPDGRESAPPSHAAPRIADPRYAMNSTFDEEASNWIVPGPEASAMRPTAIVSSADMTNTCVFRHDNSTVNDTEAAVADDAVVGDSDADEDVVDTSAAPPSEQAVRAQIAAIATGMRRLITRAECPLCALRSRPRIRRWAHAR